MSVRLRLLVTAMGALALIGAAWTDGAFCIPKTQTRVACEDHTGFCDVFAWNFKIYYTKTYECCYNASGQFTHRNVTGTAGPTSPVDGYCCQNLVSVSFTDGQWTLPSDQNATPPSDPGGG